MLDIFFHYGFVLFILIIISVYLYKKKKKLIFPFWMSVFISGIVSFALKFIVARPRILGEKLLFGLPDYSFPSTHVAVMFSVLPLLQKETKELWWYWLIYAIIIAIFRLVTQLHHFSDIIAGALIGYGIGLGIRYKMIKK